MKVKNLIMFSLAAILTVGTSITVQAEEYDAMDYEIQMGKLDAAALDSGDAFIASAVVQDQLEEIGAMIQRLQNIENSKGLLSKMSQVEFVASQVLKEAVDKKDLNKVLQLNQELDQQIRSFEVEFIRLIKQK